MFQLSEFYCSDSTLSSLRVLMWASLAGQVGFGVLELGPYTGIGASFMYFVGLMMGTLLNLGQTSLMDAFRIP